MNMNKIPRIISRNIAIVSAIFIVTFSIMLITNYFQVRGATPLQTEVVETLKEINNQNANNPVLQEQIRQLDLLARKAYFVRMDHLLTGVYILLGMLAVFIICTRLYFAREKDIPDKEIDPVDEWAIKTKARKYIVWVATGIAASALVFVMLSSPYMKPSGQPEVKEQPEMIAEVRNTENATEPPVLVEEEPALPDEDTTAVTDTSVVEIAQPVISKVTHNTFRGNNSTGISSAKGLPVKWDLSNGTNIAWKQDIPRKGFNSPVINGNKIFFSGADEEAKELFCYELSSGKQLWKLTAKNISGSPGKAPETTEDTGLAASSVATNGNQVCAIFATGDVICADMEGKQLWAKNIGVPDNTYGYASSLLTFGNLLIIQYDNQNAKKVIALDLATGNQRWAKDRAEKYPSWSSPIIATIDNKPQLILVGNPGITSYNPNNGEQNWRVEAMSGEPAPGPAYANGIVFAATEYARLVAINGTDGSILWESNEFLPEVASPVATKNNLYLATSYGTVVSYDTQTGQLRKEHELNTEFYSSPIIAEGKIYLFGNDGKMYIFSADDEFRLLSSFETGEKTFATPAFTDGKIVVRTEKSIYCVTNGM